MSKEPKPVAIIMIEDDEGHARLIEKNIRRAGVTNEIISFRDGTTGVNYLLGSDGSGLVAIGRPSLVLLDLNLPDMTGIDILARLKANEHTRRTPEGVEPWNKGMELAQRAAQEVGGKVVAPIFTAEERANGLTDFNDLHQSRGLDEVKRQVGLVLQKDVGQEKDRERGRARELSL